MLVDQIKRMYAALNHGHMNLIVKVGNMSDDFVLRSMKLPGKHVFPEVKALGKTKAGVAAE